MKIGSLFSGYGGLDMAIESVTGATTVWVSDVDKGACKVLAHRYPHVPNIGDITQIDWHAVEPVDIIAGGFPCQDVSMAGRRAGLRDDTRTGLWAHMLTAIATLQPRLVIAENVRGLLSAHADSDVEPCPWCVGDNPDQHMRALGAVLADLADIGYDARWCGLRAADVGAPHGRFRVFIVAYPGGQAGDERPGLRTNGSPRHGGRQSARSSWSDVCLLPTPMVGSVNDAAHNQISGQYRADMERALSRWGDYADAIARWEHIIGRPAPAPTQTSNRGNQQLSPRFAEWMMGVPDGWITDVPDVTRVEALRMCGNGVVPQQAETALQHLIKTSEVAA